MRNIFQIDEILWKHSTIYKLCASTLALYFINNYHYHNSSLNCSFNVQFDYYIQLETDRIWTKWCKMLKLVFQYIRIIRIKGEMTIILLNRRRCNCTELINQIDEDARVRQTMKPLIMWSIRPLNEQKTILPSIYMVYCCLSRHDIESIGCSRIFL